jgi:hypothetical protein
MGALFANLEAKKRSSDRGRNPKNASTKFQIPERKKIVCTPLWYKEG